MTGKWGEIKRKLDLVRVIGVLLYYGSTVPYEQRKNIEQFRMNKVSGPIFHPVENSTGTVA